MNEPTDPIEQETDDRDRCERCQGLLDSILYGCDCGYDEDDMEAENG